jgi:hypothetical protein
MGENEESVGFRIGKLDILGYTFQKPEVSIPTDRIDFSMKHKVDIQPENSSIIFVLKPKFTSGKREPKLIAELIFQIEFDVQGLENILKKEGENFSLPEQFIVTLFSISYSTMRGVFFEKSRGTMAERLIIPIIDPKNITQLDDSASES